MSGLFFLSDPSQTRIDSRLLRHPAVGRTAVSCKAEQRSGICVPHALERRAGVPRVPPVRRERVAPAIRRLRRPGQARRLPYVGAGCGPGESPPVPCKKLRCAPGRFAAVSRIDIIRLNSDNYRPL